jgi:transcriptional regulator with XRE-family HTH domain
MERKQSTKPIDANAQTDWKEELGKRIVAARGALSQAQLAFKSGVSDRTISILETATFKHTPKAATIVRLALAVDADPVEWLRIANRTMPLNRIDGIRKNMETAGHIEKMHGRLVGSSGHNSSRGDLWKALYELRAHYDNRFDEILKRLGEAKK